MLDIVLYGNDVLRKKTSDIEEITPEIVSLVDEMFDTMYASEGIGLAAPQVGRSLNLTILDLSVGFDPESKLVLINPEIIESEGEQFEDEGCLSFPGLIAKILRPAWVKVKYIDLNGDEREITGENLLARALSHEIDHLNGIVFVDHVKGLEKTMINKKLKKLMNSESWQRVS